CWKGFAPRARRSRSTRRRTPARRRASTRSIRSGRGPTSWPSARWRWPSPRTRASCRRWCARQPRRACRSSRVAAAAGSWARRRPARSVGLDPARLLVGTEGTLGIVTEATLAVLPRPEERLVRGYRMPSFEAGVAVAARCRRTGIRVASLDVSAEDLPPAPASLLIVFDGLRGEAHLHAERAL